MKSRASDLLILNGIVLLLSTNILFSRFIQLPPEIIILGRTIVAFPVLWLFLRWRKGRVKIQTDRISIFFIGLTGVILAFHWVAYFSSGRVSSIAVAVVTLYTYPLFTVFFEFIILKRPVLIRDLILGAMIVTGVYIMSSTRISSGGLMPGILWGIGAAITFALRNVLTRKYLAGMEGTAIMMIQVGVVAVVLLPLAFIIRFEPTKNDIALLLILGILLTSFAHTLYVISILRMPVKSVGIIAGVQPVYSILFAYLFFHEVPEKEVFVGGSFILLASFSETLYQVWTREKEVAR